MPVARYPEDPNNHHVDHDHDRADDNNQAAERLTVACRRIRSRCRCGSRSRRRLCRAGRRHYRCAVRRLGPPAPVPAVAAPHQRRACRRRHGAASSVVRSRCRPGDAGPFIDREGAGLRAATRSGMGGSPPGRCSPAPPPAFGPTRPITPPDSWPVRPKFPLVSAIVVLTWSFVLCAAYA